MRVKMLGCQPWRDEGRKGNVDDEDGSGSRVHEVHLLFVCRRCCAISDLSIAVRHREWSVRSELGDLKTQIQPIQLSSNKTQRYCGLTSTPCCSVSVSTFTDKLGGGARPMTVDMDCVNANCPMISIHRKRQPNKKHTFRFISPSSKVAPGLMVANRPIDKETLPMLL